MSRRTIVEAIVEVMKLAQRPLTVKEAYDAIVEYDLYTFNTDQPVHVVRSQIRRHCEGIDFTSASPIKHFVMRNGAYWLDEDLTVPPVEEYEKPSEVAKTDLLSDLRQLHNVYLANFRNRLLDQIRELHPEAFEYFSKKLLLAYGFSDIEVTSYSKDGGIDGYGFLRVGLAHLRVAFQCKRWKKNVSRPEIDRFRGAIQGKFEQGIFLTTSQFTSGAQQISFQPGAVPIVLMDGSLILDIMLEKRFGREIDYLPIYSNALDIVLES